MADENTKILVWGKGHNHRKIGNDSYCEDDLGNTIRYGAYDTTYNDGWEIDHEIPKSRGGSDDISNLRPLQWKANREKADKIAYEDDVY